MQLKNKNFIILKPSCDTREFFSRDDNKIQDLPIGNENTDFNSYDFVLIDEIQFFSKQFLTKIIFSNQNFYLFGLSSNAKLTTFNYLPIIFPHLTNITILKAICEDCNKQVAKYHIPLSNKKLVMIIKLFVLIVILILIKKLILE